MKTLLVLATLSALALPAFAEDLTIGNVTYKNFTVTDVRPHEISIMHDEGMARVPLAKCPPSIQSRYGFDPEKAAAAALVDAKARADGAVKLAAAERKRQAEAAKEKTIKQNTALVFGRVIDVCDQGVIIDCDSRGQSTYIPASPPVDKLARVGGFVGGTPKATQPPPLSAAEQIPWAQDIVLLVGDPRHKTIASGDYIKVVAWRDGVSNLRTKNDRAQHTTIALFRHLGAP